MNIVVLNGSPKGELSVTLQYVHYLERKLPAHTFTRYDIAQRARHLERDTEAFQKVIDGIAAADIVLWSFPLYYMLVHGNYKRFIELIWERGATTAFKGKTAASLSTSIHFFDHTAHAYIQAISEDLGMSFTGAFAAEMQDLFDADKRKALLSFATDLITAAVAKTPTPRRFAPLNPVDTIYEPAKPASVVDADDKHVVILTDATSQEANLQRMVDHLQTTLGDQVETINLHEVDIKGGCLGCLHCGYDNVCAYEGKDGYIAMHRERLQRADIVFFAGSIRDRYLSATWKTFFDRSFFKTHTPAFSSKQFGWLVSGPLSQIQNLREIIAAWTQLERANLVGIVTDECRDSATIDALIEDLAARSVRYARQGTVMPQDFLGVGGTKIFRDDVWGPLRTVFRADHRAYKQMGFYDFPQKEWRVRLLNSVTGVLFYLPFIRNAFTSRLKEQMVRPYQRLLAELDSSE